MRVTRIRERLNERIPVGLVFTDVMTEARGDLPVVTLSFPVGLCLICTGRLTYNTKNVTNGLLEFGEKLENFGRPYLFFVPYGMIH